MEATDAPFSKIIQGNDQFQIPVFQRDYTWTDVQCSQLWSDIVQNGRSKSERGHFIGSVVYMAAAKDIGAAFRRWLVVDGQQRLTSLTLMMIALRDHIVDSGWVGGEDSPTRKRIDAYFLKNTQESGDRRRKLVLRRRDDATLEALVNGTELPDDYSPLIKDAYERFLELMMECNPDEIYQEVSRLVVVDVTLNRQHDDPQLVFESLNSTGVTLGASDLIRNYLLMGLEEGIQTGFYTRYWNRVERVFRGFNEGLNSFLRDYIAVKTKALRQIRQDQIYGEFKKTFRLSDDNGVEDLLRDLARTSVHYASFYVRPHDGIEGQALGEALKNLRQRGDAASLLVMCLFDHCDRGAMTTSDFIEALRLIESYLVRRATCGLQTRNYWAVFSNIAHRLGNSDPRRHVQVSIGLDVRKVATSG